MALSKNVTEKVTPYFVEREKSKTQHLSRDCFTRILETYKTYWRDDPEFDSNNTKIAAPHLPCPEINAELLKHLGDVATEMDFRFTDDSSTLEQVPENTHA